MATITVDTATTFQTMDSHPLEVTFQMGEIDSPVYSSYKDYMIDLAVNQMKVHRMRAEIRPLSDGSDIDWSTFDTKFANVILPYKAAVEAAGFTFKLNLCYVHRYTINGVAGAGPTSPWIVPATFASTMKTAYERCRDVHGVTPATLEVLEPEIFGWSTNNTSGQTSTTLNPAADKLGDAVKAAGDAFVAAGYPSRIWILPSCTNTANTQVVVARLRSNKASAWAYAQTLCWHNYTYSDSDMADLAATAATDGMTTAMLEHIAADYLELIRCLKSGNISTFHQYTLAYPNVNGDNGAQLYWIDNSGLTPATQAIIGSRTKLLQQYFKWIRGNSVRVAASSDDAVLNPVAFKGPGVCVVNSTGSKTFDIVGMPAGTYDISYTTSGSEVVVGTQTIGAGGTLTSLSIPAAGALTVAQQFVSGAAAVSISRPTITGGSSVANAPSITTAARSAAADAVTALIGSGANLVIYDGTPPATVNAALSSNNVLAVLPLSSTPFGAASSGVATANTITTDSSADASGTATFFRIRKSDGTTYVMQGSVGTSGCDLNLVTTSIVSGQPVSVTSLTYTQSGS